jgi:hypothetical protein
MYRSQRIFALTSLLALALVTLACGEDDGATGTGGQGGPGTGGQGPGGGGGGGTGGGAGPCLNGGTLPRLHVEGNLIKDPCGKTIILRGSSLIDLGAISAWENGDSGIKARIDALMAAGLAGHVVRLPVYPRTVTNPGYPYYSPVPYPVGPAAPASAKLDYQVTDLTADQYVATILRPAIDYATQKGLYAIIDYHQIDNTDGVSGTDANTFWMQVAPLFKDAANVLYEVYNEPIDTTGAATARWAAYEPRAQGWVDTIRAVAPDTLLIVGSPSWDQNPGPSATTPITGSNIVYTAHIYPGNWNATFKAQVEQCLTKSPVFVTEWGYTTGASDKNLNAPTAAWGTDVETYFDAKGVSWTAWVADKGWAPPLYATDGTSLTDFGTLVKGWLAAKAASDWVQ